MKLIQANIWGGRLDKAITDLILGEKPTFLNFQEVFSIEGDFRSMFFTLQDLQQQVNFHDFFYSPVFGFSFMNTGAEWGNAMLSTIPMLNKETIFTNLEYKTNFNFKEFDYNIRNLQNASFDIKGKKLHILNHHGHHIPSHKEGDKETMRQCKMIAEYVKTLSGAVILTGDFNLAPNSKSLEQINTILTNLSVEYKLKTTRTPLTHKTEVCDYIFVSDGIKVKDFYASDELISDHKALILDFDIR